MFEQKRQRVEAEWIGIKPEHVPAMLEEARAIVADTGMDLAKKVEGIQTRIRNFEVVAEEFERWSDNLLVKNAEQQETLKLRISSPVIGKDPDFEKFHTDWQDIRDTLDEAQEYMDAAELCYDGIKLLKTAEIPLADPIVLDITKYKCKLAESIIQGYRTMASGLRFFRVDELETIRDNLKDVIAIIRTT